uniref:Uncharacterized protein n=1 Tax=Anopheles atroparvus TaxID=41427 RepID=A0A182IRH7_ANOAO
MYGKRHTLPRSTANPITASRNSAFWLQVSRRRSPVSATTMLRSLPLCSTWATVSVVAVGVVPEAGCFLPPPSTPEFPFVAGSLPSGGSSRPRAPVPATSTPDVPLVAAFVGGGDAVCHESRFLAVRDPDPPEPADDE